MMTDTREKTLTDIDGFEVADWEWIYTVRSPGDKVVGTYIFQGEAQASLDTVHAELYKLGVPGLIESYRITRRKRATRFWIAPEEDVND